MSRDPRRPARCTPAPAPAFHRSTAIAALVVLGGCAAFGSRIPAHVEKMSVVVQVPNPCWRLAIRSVHRRGNELLVVSELLPPPRDLFCAQVLSEARESIGVRVDPPKRVHHLVLGRTWDWGDESAARSGITFVGSDVELGRLLEGAEPLTGFKAVEGPDS